MNNQGSNVTCCMCSEICCHIGTHSYCSKHNNEISNPPPKSQDPNAYRYDAPLPVDINKSKEDQIIDLLTQLLVEAKQINDNLYTISRNFPGDF